jgi:quercetin dioxygenase-like cupin family protein
MTEPLYSKVHHLKELIAYQEDAIVSRVLMRKKAGNITLFAFAAGQELSEHTAPYDAFVYVLDGEAEITLSGVKHRVSAGEILIMPANQPHALYAIEPFKMLLVMIKSGDPSDA